uniref:DUF1376 domain-containing protein n=1 Tax=viral metagenome TaxID=1070528 RepID=A0A6M3JMT3_9ZZZZ
MMSDQYYPFYPGDYLKDTLGLSLVEHGAYRIMLDHYYCEESLPANRERLCRICKAFTEEERKAVDMIAERYFEEENGNLYNNRAEIEIEKRRKFLEQQSRKGKISAEKRRVKK